MREVVRLLVQPLANSAVVVGVQADVGQVQVGIEIDVAAALAPAFAEHVALVPDTVGALDVVEEHPRLLLTLQGLVAEFEVCKLGPHLLQRLAGDPHETGRDGGDLPQAILLKETIRRPAQREIPRHVLERIRPADHINGRLAYLHKVGGREFKITVDQDQISRVL